jgi:hypothetical protein
MAVPNRTAVPAGEDLTSSIPTAPLVTGNTDKNPVLSTVGSPFTVVTRAVESALETVWDTCSLVPQLVWFG